VLSKLREFHQLHELDPETTRINLRHAAASLPEAEQPREWAHLATQRDEACRRRGRKAAELAAILAAVLDEPGKKAAQPIVPTPASDAESYNHDNVNIEANGTDLGPSAPGLPTAQPRRGGTPRNSNNQAVPAASRKHENININENKTNLEPPAAGLPTAEPRRQRTGQHSNSKATHGPSQHDENINTKSNETNLGPPAAGLPLGEPARKPAVPRDQGPGPVGRTRRGCGPQPLSAILPVVLQRILGGDAAQVIESIESGETP
jgi:hypothetical protein